MDRRRAFPRCHGSGDLAAVSRRRVVGPETGQRSRLVPVRQAALLYRRGRGRLRLRQLCPQGHRNGRLPAQGDAVHRNRRQGRSPRMADPASRRSIGRWFCAKPGQTAGETAGQRRPDADPLPIAEHRLFGLYRDLRGRDRRHPHRAAHRRSRRRWSRPSPCRPADAGEHYRRPHPVRRPAGARGRLLPLWRRDRHRRGDRPALDPHPVAGAHPGHRPQRRVLRK